METLGKNPGKIRTDNPEGVAPLPNHVLRDRICIYCGHAPFEDFETYTDYVDWWLDNEYEGAPGHKPQEKRIFEYLRDTCLA